MYSRKDMGMGGNQPMFDFAGEAEKAARSVFVGNIPYEATEEQLKSIFSEIGVVLSFRLVYDRETGKPKGYGFCEYQDQETALSAMRNLNQRELHGRNLRVDHATRDHGIDPKDLQATANRSGTIGPGGPVAPPVETPYGQSVNPEDAPAAISQAVASLPPEQMYSLMKDMKEVIMNNPVEARNMLLQNPQLAYALLQAQVVMRIVNPDNALRMLHPKTNTAKPLAQPSVPMEPVSVSKAWQPPPQIPQPVAQVPLKPPQHADPRPRHTQPPPQSPAVGGPPQAMGGAHQTQDREKLALIQQVLQLTPEQINMLPEDQKRSILALKEQIRANQGRS